METTVPSTPQSSLFKRLASLMGWNRSSATLMGVFLLLCSLIVYVWWPLAEEYLAYVDWSGEWWLYIDWLLIGIFLVMSLLIMAGADIRADLPIIFIGLIGGLIIESWGTQTELWTYYTNERPPLWILPAWPIASLSIDRLVRLTLKLVPDRLDSKMLTPAYLLIFGAFFILLLIFVMPTITASMTLAALLLCVMLSLAPKDIRVATLTFIAGASLGYFLERWGTTRLCWVYYTEQTTPLFAVLAHGMAAVAFWRVKDLFEVMVPRLLPSYRR